MPFIRMARASPATSALAARASAPYLRHAWLPLFSHTKTLV